MPLKRRGAGKRELYEPVSFHSFPGVLVLRCGDLRRVRFSGTPQARGSDQVHRVVVPAVPSGWYWDCLGDVSVLTLVDDFGGGSRCGSKREAQRSPHLTTENRVVEFALRSFRRPCTESSRAGRARRSGANDCIMRTRRPPVPNTSCYHRKVRAREPASAGGVIERLKRRNRDPQYEILDISNPQSVVLGTVEGVQQRLERSETGTLFLLGNSGLTVIRQPSVEHEHAAELAAQSGNLLIFANRFPPIAPWHQRCIPTIVRKESSREEEVACSRF